MAHEATLAQYNVSLREAMPTRMITVVLSLIIPQEGDGRPRVIPTPLWP